ncbi:membrane protein [Herbaspirillum hiltneri N3]|uniref:Membrane protein n=1 Tax=Herbaspirillum hiltneri N3 TaxID=1262470 RepID=A0ABN4I3G9_9BURK|nr:YetF domain-containing protein [Herbaspirillum hiltneri]AKZ65517.1 membrane protein [Herbaspirillum hiltneri N3]
MNIDWSALFQFSVPIEEIVVRGTLMYAFLFILFRLLLRRDVGNVGISDFLLVVIIADASQNGMSGDANSVPDAMLLVLTLTFWNYAIDFASYYSKPLQRLLEPRPLTLIRNGKVLRRNMRKEFVTMAEIESKLRENGVTDISHVREMIMESDGEISVIRKDQK